MYLKRLYNQWRPAFWLLLGLLGMQFFFMYKGIQNLPFFLYHMYSKEHRSQDSIPVFLLKTPYGYLNHKQLSNREEELLLNSANYYLNLQKDGDGTAGAVEKRFRDRVSLPVYGYLYRHLVNDSNALKRFPHWWGRYARSILGRDMPGITLVRSYVYARPPFLKSPVDSILFNSASR